MEELKKLIRSHLNKVTEANVKQIAKATGRNETEVINALNAMRTYGEVECEQHGRGKGMMYWLTAVENTEAAQAGSDTPCCNAAKVMAKTAEQILAEKDAELLTQAALVVDLRLDLGKAESQRDAWREVFAEIDLADTPDTARAYLCGQLNHIAALESLQADGERARDRIDGLQDEIDRRGENIATQTARIETLETAVDAAQQTIRTLELEAQQKDERIAALESNGDLLAQSQNPRIEDMIAKIREAAGAPDDVTIFQLPEFIGALRAAAKEAEPPFYVSVGRDNDAHIHKDLEVATRRAKSLVRQGDKAGLVLVPILKAVKGVELVEVGAA